MPTTYTLTLSPGPNDSLERSWLPKRPGGQDQEFDFSSGDVLTVDASGFAGPDPELTMSQNEKSPNGAPFPLPKRAAMPWTSQPMKCETGGAARDFLFTITVVDGGATYSWDPEMIVTDG